jgi:hypothetical protein
LPNYESLIPRLADSNNSGYVIFFSYLCSRFYEGVIGGKGRGWCQQITGQQWLGTARKQ